MAGDAELIQASSCDMQSCLNSSVLVFEQLGSQQETDGTLKLGDLRRVCERSVYKGMG
jgi:hypothetical protein